MRRKVDILQGRAPSIWCSLDFMKVNANSFEKWSSLAWHNWTTKNFESAFKIGSWAEKIYHKVNFLALLESAYYHFVLRFLRMQISVRFRYFFDVQSKENRLVKPLISPKFDDKRIFFSHDALNKKFLVVKFNFKLTKMNRGGRSIRHKLKLNKDVICNFFSDYFIWKSFVFVLEFLINLI